MLLHHAILLSKTAYTTKMVDVGSRLAAELLESPSYEVWSANLISKYYTRHYCYANIYMKIFSPRTTDCISYFVRVTLKVIPRIYFWSRFLLRDMSFRLPRPWRLHSHPKSASIILSWRSLDADSQPTWCFRGSPLQVRVVRCLLGGIFRPFNCFVNVLIGRADRPEKASRVIAIFFWQWELNVFKRRLMWQVGKNESVIHEASFSSCLSEMEVCLHSEMVNFF